MIEVDNKEFLVFFEKDIVKNFYVCDNIANAGRDGYGIKNIKFFTDDGRPSDSYVSLCENVWSELTVSFFTTDFNLLEDAFREVLKTFKNYSVVRFGVNALDFFNMDEFKQYFNITASYETEYGVFASLSSDTIPQISYPSQIEIKIQDKLKNSAYAEFSDKKWDGLASQIKYGNDNDLLFLLFEGEQLCGYLFANNTYKNIYDISNVFVSKKKRGNGYGRYLTVFFADYCYKNGFIPHYGTAVSSYSEKVALSSGFEEISRTHYASVEVKHN
nr:hypothetical protein [uncultured bacterium]